MTYLIIIERQVDFMWNDPLDKSKKKRLVLPSFFGYSYIPVLRHISDQYSAEIGDDGSAGNVAGCSKGMPIPRGEPFYP